MTPVIRTTAVMLEGKDSQMIGIRPEIDGEWKAWHQVPSDPRSDNSEPFGSHLNGLDGAVGNVEKLRTESGQASLIELSGTDQFRLGLRVVDQPHLIARRAACMTSSWVRPVTPPEESSRSRRTESCKATPSSAASNPASMLCQSAWANKTLSESGRAMASLRSCCWADMQKQVTIDATPVNPGLKPCGHTTNGVTRARVWLLVGWGDRQGWFALSGLEGEVAGRPRAPPLGVGRQLNHFFRARAESFEDGVSEL